MAEVYKRPIYRVTCWRCRTMSDFNYDEVKYEKYDSYNEYWHDFVTCPVCGAATELTDYNGNGPTKINCETDPLIEIVYPNEAEL